MCRLRHAFVPPKIRADQPERRITGTLVGSFRSIGDHRALNNDDYTGYSAIIGGRGGRVATSEQQGCAQSRCIHHLTEMSCPPAVAAFRAKQQHVRAVLDAIIAAPGQSRPGSTPRSRNYAARLFAPTPARTATPLQAVRPRPFSRITGNRDVASTSSVLRS